MREETDGRIENQDSTGKKHWRRNIEHACSWNEQHKEPLSDGADSRFHKADFIK